MISTHSDLKLKYHIQNDKFNDPIQKEHKDFLICRLKSIPDIF